MISSPDYEAYKADLDKIQGASENNGMADSSSRTIVQMVREATENARVRAEENRKHIIDNTFQYNPDGTNYGVGTDGKTYSYTMFNNRVKDIKPLSVDDQKKAISDLSLGRVQVDDSITDPDYLTQIHRSLKRMVDYGGGNMIPDYVNIKDPFPGGAVLFDTSLGITRWNEGTQDNPDEIEYKGTAWPKAIESDVEDAIKRGHNVGNKDGTAKDVVPTHELAHAVNISIQDILRRQEERELKEAEKYKDQYSLNDLVLLAVKRLFFEPDAEPEEYYYSVGSRMKSNIRKKYGKLYAEFNHDGDYSEPPGVFMAPDADLQSIFEKAAKNLGYKDSLEALGNVSEYAMATEDEAFAEIYTDVLLNGDDADPYSKEVMKEYEKVADKWSKRTGRNAEFTKRKMKETFSVPDLTKGNFLTELERSKNLKR